MKLTRYGRTQWLGSALVALPIVLFAPCLGYPSAAIVAGALWLAIAAFFRDPTRQIPTETGLFVAPADGVVTHVETQTDTEETRLLGCPEVLRISIFLSVFDVHINRAPCDLTVDLVEYRKGRFLDARDPECHRRNESNTMVCTAAAAYGRTRLAVKQISGLIARRIVCDTVAGRSLRRGDRYGMIKFGSRTDLYVPTTTPVRTLVGVGDRVHAGRTAVLAYQARAT